MKSWSDIPVHEEFCIKFFLDTNLLVYLIDSTYPRLNDFINILNNSPFARIISSRYVIFEFVGARKREHYFRIAAKNSESTPDGNINFSSLFKFRDQFDNPNAVFKDEIKNIKKAVNEEIERISRDFNIDFEYSFFHSDQLQPTIEVCLASKISNHDSLVLISAILPQSKGTEQIVLLTNDGAFVNSYYNENVETILKNKSIKTPELLKIDNIPEDIILLGKDCTDQKDLEDKVKTMLGKQISKKMGQKFIGKTFPPTGADFPNDCISFSMALERTLKNGLYITVLGKGLDFIYTTKKPVEFWNNGAPIEGEFLPQQDNRNISCKIVDVDENDNEIAVQDIINYLRTEGNFVFIHPDNQ
jgi:hypothetical protein